MSRTTDRRLSESPALVIRQHLQTLLADQPGLTDALLRWHEASYDKTLAMALDGKLSPATLVFRLRHTPTEGECLERLATVCAAMHTAADLADDCEDDDLNPAIWTETDKPQAINVASGLLFTVYQAIDSLPINHDQRRQVSRIVTDAGLSMHIGQALDLASTDRVQPADYPQIGALKAGAEVGAFLAIAAVILDRKPDPYHRLGLALGALIQAVSDIVDVWLLPESPDLIAGKQGLPMALGLAVDPIGVRHAAAGDRTRPERQRLLRQVLCQPQVIARWRRLLDGWAADARSALGECGDEPDLRALAEDVIGQAEELFEALVEAAPQMRQPSKRQTAPLRLPALMLAEQFLADARSPQDAIEYQRSGLFSRSEVVADVFGPALVADVLHEAGHDQSGVCEQLSRLADGDGWRYYPNQFEIPPDADDLGQLLLLFQRATDARKPLPESVERAVAAILPYCQLQGRLPVWLYTTATVSQPESWAGDDCPGAIATGVAGLSLLRRPEWQPVLKATVEWLLDARGADGLWRGFHYFEPQVCTMFVIRGLLAQRPCVPPALRERIDAVFAAVGRQLADSQRLDGSWGSPQATACALTTWLMVDPAPAGLPYAVIFLAEAQEFDGGWLAEPLYVTFAQDDRVAQFRSRQMTSALCLRALHRAEVRRRELAAAPLMMPVKARATR
jgi:geranylgeranyl pyrophosphate synthase